jgi:RNA polymerase sigma factor (TIGR02999 family)
MPTSGEITLLLESVRAGDRRALDELFAVVYHDLRQVAHGQRLRWDGDFTLQTTALVHEAYLKLAGSKASDWRNRAHFFAVASRAMRQILVNYAERRRAAKRGGPAESLPLDEVNPVAPEAAEELLALNEALGRLEAVSERQSRVVEHRFFGGLALRETAEVLGVSLATVKRDWALASAWLREEVRLALAPGPTPADPAQ